MRTARVSIVNVRRKSGVSQPEGWLVETLGGGRLLSGIPMSPRIAMSCVAVYACVRVVSEDIAKLPFYVYRLNPDGTRTLARDHPVYKVLRKPNPWQTAFEWLEMMQSSVELRGNAYSYIKRGSDGQVQELIPLVADRVTILVSQDTGELFYRVSPGETWPTRGMMYVRAEDMLHLRAMTSNGYVGISTVAQIAESIGLTIAAEKYAAGFFGNGARPDYFLSPQTTITVEQAEFIRQRMKERHQGVERSHQVELLPTNFKLETLGLSNKDSQFLELRAFQVTDIARGFRIPPHKVGDLTRATFSNIEEQSIQYYQDGLMPRLERLEAKLEDALLMPDEREEYEIEADFSQILRGDLNTLMTALGTGRQWGLLTVNEGRRMLNLDPVDGGDNRLEPANMNPVSTGGGDTSLAELIDQQVREGKIIDFREAREQRRTLEFLRRTVKNRGVA